MTREARSANCAESRGRAKALAWWWLAATVLGAGLAMVDGASYWTALVVIIPFVLVAVVWMLAKDAA